MGTGGGEGAIDGEAKCWEGVRHAKQEGRSPSHTWGLTGLAGRTNGQRTTRLESDKQEDKL